MILSLSILFLIIAVMGYIKFKNFLNPITVMFVIWGLILPFSTINIYGLTAPKQKTLAIIVVGLVFYLFGNLIGARPYRFKFGKEKAHRSVVFGSRAELNYTFLRILFFVALVYYLYVGARAISLLFSGRHLDYIRELATSEDANELRTSTLVVLVKNFIATPTVYLAIALLPIEIFRGEKDKFIIISTIVMTFLWVITSGGRSVLLWIALYFLIVYTFLPREKHRLKISIKSIRNKIALIAGAAVILGALLYTTYSRKGNDVDLWRQIYIYFIVPVKHFEHYVEYIDSAYSGFYGYGAASFYGLLYPIVFALRLLFLGRYPEFFTTVRELSFTMLERSTLLGGNIYMNAFVTIFYQPYLDGRFVGVAIICMLFGIFTGTAYYRMSVYNDMKWQLIYLLLFQKIVFSMVRFYFTQPGQSVCMILAFFAIRYVANSKEKYSLKYK